VNETPAKIAPRLIVGLGNPGEKYRKTRHNLGFEVIREFGRREGWDFKRDLRLQGKLANGVMKDQHFYLLFPTTYMNLSGVAVRKALHYFKLSQDSLLVVVDDVYVKLGEFRLREKGSSGGHNGLKSIEYELQTQNYARLRVGVGPQDERELPDGRERFLEDYVLGCFTSGEEEFLPSVIDKGVQVISSWAFEGVEKAVRLASAKAKPNEEP